MQSAERKVALQFKSMSTLSSNSKPTKRKKKRLIVTLHSSHTFYGKYEVKTQKLGMLSYDILI